MFGGGLLANDKSGREKVKGLGGWNAGTLPLEKELDDFPIFA